MRSVVVAVGLAAGASTAAAQLEGTIQQHSFTGPLTGQPVHFNIYLPPGYSTTTQRYPVIYHLHGLGGSQGGPQNVSVPALFEQAFHQGVIGRVIVVFPNAYTDSFWADSVGGEKPAETDVVRQLIPHVDANFRTIAGRGARVVQGFSMGGFGAVKFYSKYPHVFAACVEYDGAMLTWPNMQQFHPGIAAGIFGNSGAYFNDYSPWRFTSDNAAVLDGGRPIRMVVGSLVAGNELFRDHLVSVGVPVEYVATSCAHDLGCLLSQQGLQSAAFIAGSMNLGCAGVCGANCDCSSTSPVLNVADFACFVQRFAAGSARANCDGSTAAPILNVADFACFVQEFAAGCAG